MLKNYLPKYRRLGLSVAYFRNLKGLTQEKLAERINVNTETISRIENAHTGFRSDMIFKIASGLEITLGELFTHAQI